MNEKQADILFMPLKGDIPFLARLVKMHKDGTATIYILELRQEVRCKFTKYAEARGSCAPLESVKSRFAL